MSGGRNIPVFAFRGFACKSTLKVIPSQGNSFRCKSIQVVCVCVCVCVCSFSPSLLPPPLPPPPSPHLWSNSHHPINFLVVCRTNHLTMSKAYLLLFPKLILERVSRGDFQKAQHSNFLTLGKPGLVRDTVPAHPNHSISWEDFHNHRKF